ncbi:putative transmembrane protein [Senna tora]|uniref:Putative transmembrane protein n=1 Tax=Senna tora TaxID=362788 RepID=A0A834X4E0_9FABA|nr:putative transmembrane protein [Senna tora]
MAVTHADLEPSRSRTDLSSKTGAILVILTILLGFFCFVLCLVAEATRSEATYRGDRKGGSSECVYSGSGKVPLLCAACAFIGLAIAMVVEHAYLLIAQASSSFQLEQIDNAYVSRVVKMMSIEFGVCLFVCRICFAVGEILLLAGVSIESGHLKNWNSPRSTCLVLRQGLFSAAGVFGLTTVFLAAALYLTALRAHRLSQDQHNVRRQVLESSSLYASPPLSPPPTHISAFPRENPVPTHTHNHEHLLSLFPTPFHQQKLHNTLI